MTRKEILSKLQASVGKPVRYKYPNSYVQTGRLKDRAVVRSGTHPSDAVYWTVIDLIEFPKEKARDWIRIGYYRESKARLRWAGQTTISEPVQTMKRLLAEAAKQKPWFRQIVCEAAEASREYRIRPAARAEVSD